MANERSGLYPLAYMGVEASTPPQLIKNTISPKPTFTDHQIGTIWINTLTDNIWMLTNLEGGVATWKSFSGSGSEIQVTADVGAAETIGGVIKILGGDLITTSGAVDTLTVSVSNGTAGQLIIGGGAAPAWANLTSTGGTITITEGNNSINLESSGGGGASNFQTDAGLATQLLSTINVLGGTGINTAGADATVTINVDPDLVIDSLKVNDLSNGVLISNGSGEITSIHGNAGQVLTSGGMGVSPFFSSSSGGLNWVEINTNTQIVNGTGYIINAIDEIVLTLPETASVGDRFAVVKGAGDPWYLKQNANQSICSGNVTQIEENALLKITNTNYSALEFICTLEDKKFVQRSYSSESGYIYPDPQGYIPINTSSPVETYYPYTRYQISQQKATCLEYGYPYWVLSYAGGQKILWATDPRGTYIDDYSVKWTALTVGTVGEYIDVKEIKYLNEYWFVVGRQTIGGIYSECLFVASDPSVSENWTRKITSTPSSVDRYIYSVTYGNGYYVAVGSLGKIWTATDPMGTWTLHAETIFGTDDIYGVSYGEIVEGKYFVAVGAGGKTAWTKTPTGTWTENTKGLPTSDLKLVQFVGNGWVLAHNTYNASNIYLYKCYSPESYWYSTGGDSISQSTNKLYYAPSLNLLARTTCGTAPTPQGSMSMAPNGETLVRSIPKTLENAAGYTGVTYSSTTGEWATLQVVYESEVACKTYICINN